MHPPKSNPPGAHNPSCVYAPRNVKRPQSLLITGCTLYSTHIIVVRKHSYVTFLKIEYNRIPFEVFGKSHKAGDLRIPSISNLHGML